MATPYVSDRVESAILRSICYVHTEELMSVYGLYREAFALAVNKSDYGIRAFLDKTFPSYPFKVTKKHWRNFGDWLYYGLGKPYLPLCSPWMEKIYTSLKKCKKCRAASKTVSASRLDIHPFFVGERSYGAYRNDDKVMLNNERYPVRGGLVFSGDAVVVKVEDEGPPGFDHRAKAVVTALEEEDEDDGGFGGREDPMMRDPDVMRFTQTPTPATTYYGSTS